MRKWLFIGMAALAAFGCTRGVELEQEVDVPEGRVEISFTVTSDQLSTKALGEESQLENMYVAVFGGSGYLKEYTEATRTATGTYEYTFQDNDGNDVTKVVDQFTYTFSLPITNSSRRIHLIGNGPASIPFGRDYDVLPSILGDKETGFWQMVTLANVSALQDSDGNYLCPDGNGGYRKREYPTDPYVPTNELDSKFTNVPLIRNWAKIELTAASPDSSHFTPYSFAVVNVPKQGTLVPYGGDKGFITNYKDLSFDKLRKSPYNYAGNLPASVEFDHSIPDTNSFKNPTSSLLNPDGRVKAYSATHDADDPMYAAYLYERPVPDGTIEPTYLIIYGNYYRADDPALTQAEKDAGGVMCYYKVDLMSGGQYYPVLRNFKYQVRIDEISSRGHKTPEAAAAAAGSADVSADVNASHLPDISDGKRRMAIQPYMSKTFIKAQPKKEQLYVVFYDDITGENPKPNMEPESVYWELDPETAGIIKDVEIGDPVGLDEHGNAPDNYGWRPISFAIASQEEARARTQTLRIKCLSKRYPQPGDPKESPLYREIVISLLPTQTMRVSCGDERVLLVKGTKQRIDVAVPDGLVESMFPLNFKIEAKNRSLTPDNSVAGNVLPVVSDTSIIDKSKQSFYFQRTLTWEEYNRIPSKLDYEDETRWRTFSSHFKTNCAQSATEVYVANEFFHTTHTEFTNFESFSDPRFTTSIPREVGGTVSVSAGMMLESENYQEVRLALSNLVPADGSPLQEVSEGVYSFQPTVQNMSFDFKTTTADGDVSVTLTTTDGSYEPVTLVPWRFSNVGFVDGMIMPGDASKFSHVAWGRVNSAGSSDNQVLLGFNTDTRNPHPKVRLNASSGGLNIPASYASADGYDLSTQHKSTYSGMDTYHWAELDTKNGSTQPVSLTLSSNGYVEESVSAGRLKGGLYTVDVNSSGVWTKFINDNCVLTQDVTQNQVKGSFALSITSADAGKTISKHSPSNGIMLPAGGHYTLEADVTSTNSDVYLYYAQITYYTPSGGAPLKPRSVEPDGEGNYYGYSGNNAEFIWNLPLDGTSGKLYMNAFSDKDIVITRVILRGIHGVLIDEGDTGGGDVDFGDGLGEGGEL